MGGSAFDDYDIENGYITEEELEENKLSNWEIMRKDLYMIYQFAINRCNNSYQECCDMDLSLFLDYLLYDLELQDKREEQTEERG